MVFVLILFSLLIHLFPCEERIDVNFRKNVMKILNTHVISHEVGYEVDLVGKPFITNKTLYYIKKKRECIDDCLVFHHLSLKDTKETESEIGHFEDLCTFIGPVEKFSDIYYVSVRRKSSENCLLFKLDDSSNTFDEDEEYYYLNSYPLSLNNRLFLHLQKKSNLLEKPLVFVSKEEMILFNFSGRTDLTFGWISFPLLQNGKSMNYYFQESLDYRFDIDREYLLVVAEMYDYENYNCEDPDVEIDDVKCIKGLFKIYNSGRYDYVENLPKSDQVAPEFSSKKDAFFILGDRCKFQHDSVFVYLSHTPPIPFSKRFYLVNGFDVPLSNHIHFDRGWNRFNLISKRVTNEQGSSESFLIGVSGKKRSVNFCSDELNTCVKKIAGDIIVHPRSNKFVYSEYQVVSYFQNQVLYSLYDGEMEVFMNHSASLGGFFRKDFVFTQDFVSVTKVKYRVPFLSRKRKNVLRLTEDVEQEKFDIGGIRYFTQKYVDLSSYEDIWIMSFVDQNKFHQVIEFQWNKTHECFPACKELGSIGCEDEICKCHDNDSHGHFSGEDCSECKSTWYGVNCTIYCDSADTCFGSGKCTIEGKCDCDEGYDKSKSCGTCLPGRDIQSECIHCLDHYKENNNKTCFVLKCFDDYFDDNNVCSAHGDCDFYYSKKSGNLGKCSCKPGYSGNECELWYCGEYLRNDSRACSSNGKCITSLKCECFEKYEGLFCEKYGGISSSFVYYSVLIFICCCPLILIIACGGFYIVMKRGQYSRGNAEARVYNGSFQEILNSTGEGVELENHEGHTFVELDTEEERGDSLNLGSLDDLTIEKEVMKDKFSIMDYNDEEGNYDDKEFIS